MDKIKVTVLDRSQHFDARYISSLTKLTFSQKLNAKDDIASSLLDYENTSPEICKNICKYNHTSLLEQAWMSCIIEGASRAFLAQVTRHRIFSFCSASQHYQDWSNYADVVVPIELMDKPEQLKAYKESCEHSIEDYKRMIDAGVKPEVARFCTPQGMRNNLIIAGNLREWCSFMNLRLCNRSTTEIQYVAWKIYNILKEWVPEVVTLNAVPDCMKLGVCTQGSKCCGTKWSEDQMKERFKILEK